MLVENRAEIYARYLVSMRRFIGSALAILIVISFAEQLAFAKSIPKAIKIDDRLQSVLHWLPEDTESIAVLQSPITYDVESDQPIDPESVYESTFVQYTHVCSNEVPYSDEQIIPISEFSLCIQSAGQWKHLSDGTVSTRALGYFTFLSENQSRDKDMQNHCEKNALSKFSFCGQKVYEFVLKPCYDDGKRPIAKEPTIFKCFPKPGLVIMTNEWSLMQQILSEIEKAGAARRALPEELPEWKEVDIRKRYWGLRHFQHDDPTSPRSSRSKNLAGYPYPTPDIQAIGFAFAYDSKSRVLDVRYLSTNPKRADIVKDMIVPIGFGNWGPTQIKVIRPDTVQMKVRSGSGDDWNGALNNVHPWLGVPPPWPL